MLKAIQRAEGTTPGERKLARLVDVSFFGLWSFASVHQKKSKGGRTFAHEVADLLIAFGDHVILFSEKDIRFPEHDDIGVSWGRWFRSSIAKSVDQLRGAETCVRSTASALFLDAKCTQPFPLALDSPNLKVHLVAICRNSSEPAKRYFAPAAEPGSDSSSGTLMFMASFREEGMLEQPFSVGDFDPKKTFVHVFDEVALDLLLAELDTGPDFIDYLCVREQEIRQRRLGVIHGEEDFLAAYLNSMRPDGFGEFPKDDALLAQAEAEDAHLAVPEGLWASFVQLPTYQLHRSQKAQAAIWKELTYRFADAIVTATVGEAHDESLETHERAARTLASENRIARALLGGLLYEKYQTVPGNVRSSRVVSSPSNPKRIYIFVFFPRSSAHSTYEEYRLDRRRCMDLYARAGQLKFPKYSEIVVLAAEPKGAAGSSETLLVVEGHPNMTKAERDETEEMMRRERILVNFMESPQRGATTLPAFEGKAPGVNEPCPCGSGKKYKKCCRP